MAIVSRCTMARPKEVLKFGLPCVLVVTIVVYFMSFLNPRRMSIIEDVQLSDDLNYLRQNGITNNLSVVNLDSMSEDQLLVTLHSYLDNNQVICQRKLRMGNLGDGGWEICDDLDVRPQSPCIIYSFGINYDFTFDDDASRLYGCHVYSFDPSMDKMETSNRSDKVHFHKVGLGKRTVNDGQGWNLYTFKDLRVLLGHQKAVIDVIKMDIENAEWDCIPEMISSGQMSNVRQFLVEYHVPNATRSYILPRLKSIQALERVGFRKFYVHKNHYCLKLLWQYPVPRTSCYEIHYLRQ